VLAAPVDISPLVIKEYRQDFPNLSAEQTEERLEIQQRGSAIVAELKLALGKGYAGVWFDNDAGQIVVPLLSGEDHIAVAEKLDAKGLGRDYRVMQAASNWEGLVAAQEQINKTLRNEIESGFVQTSIDPRANAVVIRQLEGASQAQRESVQEVARTQSTAVEVRESSEKLSLTTRACNTVAAKVCGRPLRGGVALTPEIESGVAQIGVCSTAFKATGKANGNRFMLTAGHCGYFYPGVWDSQDASGNFHKIGSISYTFPGGDWAQIGASGSEYWDVNPWPSEVAVYNEDLERHISYEAYSYLGEYVCVSGNQSGTSCGTVSKLEVSSEDTITGATVEHLTEFGHACILDGDSGAAIFAGETALGIFSSSDITGCAATGYYEEVTRAADAMGVTVGTRIGGAPSVTTNSASGVSSWKATLNGQVNPNSVETQYYFQYGTTSGYGALLPIPSGNAGHGTGTVGVNVDLPGLKANTTYHYRVVATNAAGTSFGSDAQFTTLSVPILGEDDNFGGAHAVVQSNGTIDVFYRTPSGALGHNAYVNGVWSQGVLPGSLASSSVPHPVVQSNGTIDVFYRTPSGALGHNAYVGGVWGQNVLPGSLASDPHAIVQSNGTIDVFYKTPTEGLGHTVYVAGSWSLAPLSGSVAGDPYPVVQSNGTIDVFYRTPTGGLGHNAYVGGFWGQPPLAGLLDPAAGMGIHAVAQSNGTIDVFYRTPSGALGHNAYVGGVWGQNVLPGEL
jgi:hypothetical protein